MKFNIFKYFNQNDTFVNYNEKQDDYSRLAILYSIFALVIAPSFFIISRWVAIPEVYVEVCLLTSGMLLVYIAVCGFIKYLRNKLIIFFVFQVFFITFYVFFSGLIPSHFESTHLVFFIGIYGLSVVVIQRFYPLVLYNIFVLGLCIYGLYYTEELVDVDFYFLGLIVLIGLTSTMVIFSRQQLLNSVEDYTEYLKTILDDPSMGYLLLRVGKNIELFDINKELKEHVFNNKTKPQIIKELFDWFNKDELKKFKNLKIGTRLYIQVELNLQGFQKTYELKISLIPLKNGEAHLIRFSDITYQEEKRKDLYNERRRYKNLYERNTSGVFSCDGESKILDANTAFMEMFENTLKKNDQLFSKDNETEWQIIKSTINEGENKTNNSQFQYNLNNGSVKTFVFNWYFDRSTEVYEGFVIDLTPYQKATQALKQSEEKYRSIFEASNEAILLLDGDRIINANHSALDLFEEVINVNLFDLSADKSSVNYKKYLVLKSKLAEGRLIQFDWEFLGYGKNIEAEVSMKEIVLDEHIYYQCVINNRTEIKKMLKDLEGNHKNLKNILDNSPEGILILNNNKVLYTNPTLEKLLGNEWRLDNIFEGEEAEQFMEAINNQKSNGGRVNLQLQIINDNQPRVIDLAIGTTIFQEEEAQFLHFKDVSANILLANEKLRVKLIEETNKTLEKEITKRIETQQKLEEQFIRTKSILESSSNTFLLTLNLQGEIISFNTQCAKFFTVNLKTELKEGQTFRAILRKLISPQMDRLFGRLILSIRRNKSKQIEIELINNGRSFWLEVYMSPIVNTKGEVTEISLVAHDISEKKKSSIEIINSLKEKEVLLKEIHHRVKNNLQVISSILNLQSSFVTDVNTLKILQESRNRIRSMAIIHESLYRKADFASINFSEYIQNLVYSLISSYGYRQQIHVHLDLEEVSLNLDQAIPCGLIVNELVSNAIKYAWPDQESGNITLRLKEEKNRLQLEISDDGIGLPEPFEEMNSDTLGLQLVITLIDQLDGEITVANDEGTKYLINFEKIKPNSNSHV